MNLKNQNTIRQNIEERKPEIKNQSNMKTNMRRKDLHI